MKEILKKKYDNYLETGQLSISGKKQVEWLDKTHKELFNAPIDKSCGKCKKESLKKVMEELYPDYKLKIVKAQTFPKAEKPEQEKKRSIDYGKLDSLTYKQYFAQSAFSIKETVRKLRLPLKTAIHYNCVEGGYVFALINQGIEAKGYKSTIEPKNFESYTGKDAIVKGELEEGKTDLLVYLEGNEEKLIELIDIVKPKYVHTHIELPKTIIKVIPTLKEGRLYLNNK